MCSVQLGLVGNECLRCKEQPYLTFPPAKPKYQMSMCVCENVPNNFLAGYTKDPQDKAVFIHSNSAYVDNGLPKQQGHDAVSGRL